MPDGSKERARLTNWLFQPCTLPEIQTELTILPVSFFYYLKTYVLQIFKRINPKRNEGVCFCIKYMGFLPKIDGFCEK